jgi:CDP-6-deoxy-D-xylo-4-hexulose-3-dehydrase
MTKYPLMKNNILRSDLDKVITFLKKKDPILTQNKNVKMFEKNGLIG